jgi:hypothetical protein
MLVIVVSAALASAAQWSRTASAEEPPRDAAGAERERREAVLASVGGQPITVGDFEDAIASKDLSTRRRLASPEGRARFLEDLIRYDVLVQAARARGYAERDVVVHREHEAAIAAMQGRSLTVEPAAIPAADVERYYTDNARRFHHETLRRGSFIQVQTAEEARALIAELRGKDRNTFAKAARERSTDARTRSQGGELGHVERHEDPKAPPGVPRAPQVLIDAVYALKKVGDISPAPIAIDGQFGIVMLTAELPGASIPQKQVEDDIRAELASKRSASELDALAARLREEQKPELHPELVDRVKLDPPAPPPDIPAGFRPDPPDPRAPATLLPRDLY